MPIIGVSKIQVIHDASWKTILARQYIVGCSENGLVTNRSRHVYVVVIL